MAKKENKAVTNNGKKENGFVAFCKKAWAATVAFCKKAWAATVEFFKTTWEKIKNIPWNQPVKPAVAWGIIGGVLAVAVLLMLLFWL